MRGGFRPSQHQLGVELTTIGKNTPYQVGSVDNPAKNLLEEVASELRDMAVAIQGHVTDERLCGFCERLKVLAQSLENAETK